MTYCTNAASISFEEVIKKQTQLFTLEYNIPSSEANQTRIKIEIKNKINSMNYKEIDGQTNGQTLY